MIAEIEFQWSSFFSGSKPDAQYNLPEWSERYRILTSKTSAEPGPWRNDRTPYLISIMNDLSIHSEVEIIILMKGSQIGATEIGNNWIGYIIDRYPANILYIMPTLETLKRNVKIRINPLLNETPCLKYKVSPARSRDGSNTLFNKEFNGGALIMTGANSAVGMKSLPAKYVMLDEVEDYSDDLDGQGDPVSLAYARTRTFGRKRKIYIPSTPQTKGRSKIETLFESGDQNYYHVPCPDCKKFQPLDFENIKYENNDPQTAMYCCEFCGVLFKNSKKETILRLGKWISKKKPIEKNLKSYHLSSLYSPVGWYSWSDVVRDWIDAQGKPMKLKTFLNTVLGKTWEERGEAPDWEKIYNRRDEYNRGEPPNVPMVICTGVDIQADRIELEIVGFCEHGNTYSCDYKILVGDTSSGDVWGKLIKEILKPVIDQKGNKRKILMVGVDSGFQTTKVYQLARDYPNLIMPIKGANVSDSIVSRAKPIEMQFDGKTIKTGVSLYTIGVNLIKSEFYSLIRINEKGKPGYQFFPCDYDTEYFQQLVSESLQRKKSKLTGRVSYIYVKNRDRNEALDCRVYARAAAEFIGYSRIKHDEWPEVGNIFHDETPTTEIKKTGRRIINSGI